MGKVRVDHIVVVRLFIHTAAFCLLAYSIFPCIGLTFDSELYLRTAAGLSEKGLMQPGFLAKPPLYPLIIYTLGNSLWALSVLNLLCWAISVVLIESMLTKLPHQSDVDKVLYSLCVASSTSLFLVHNFVWTEPVFSVLVFYFLTHLGRIHKKSYLALAVVALLMVTLRHIGILFVFGGILSLIYSKEISKRDLVWIATSFSFFVLWQAFVYSRRGDLERLDHFASLDLLGNFQQLSEGLMHWFWPFEGSVLSYLFPLLIGGVLSYTFLSHKDQGMRALCVITLGHLVMIVSKGDLIYDDVERYLFFLHPVLLPVVYSLLREVKVPKYVALTMVLLIATYTIMRTVKNSLFWHDAFCP